MSEIKKRGRKPKSETAEILKQPIKEPQIPKKRGRRPLDKAYCVSELTKPTNNIVSENIILHLPIHSKDIEPELCEEHTNIEPQPFQQDRDSFQIIDKETPHDYGMYEHIKNGTQTETNGNMAYKEIINKVSKLSENDIRKEIMDEILPEDKKKIILDRNLITIQYSFIDNNQRNTWPQSTNICCMWDCCKFEGAPVAIPDKLINGRFYVYGCFCSFNCAASYVLNENTYAKWERYALLNILVNKIYGINRVKIKMAPPRQMLQMFGGPMDINEFRLSFLTMKEYNLIEYPMISIVPKIEENNYKIIDKNTKFIPIDHNIIKIASLNTKKTKSETNALEEFMRLKIT